MPSQKIWKKRKIFEKKSTRFGLKSTSVRNQPIAFFHCQFKSLLSRLNQYSLYSEVDTCAMLTKFTIALLNFFLA